MNQILDALDERRSARSVRADQRQQLKDDQEKKSSCEVEARDQSKLKTSQGSDDGDNSVSCEMNRPGTRGLNSVSAASNERALRMESAVERIQERAFEHDNAFLIRPERLSLVDFEEILVDVPEESRNDQSGDPRHFSDERSRVVYDANLQPWMYHVSSF